MDDLAVSFIACFQHHKSIYTLKYGVFIWQLINWQTEKQTVFLSKYLQFLILKTMFLLDILHQSIGLSEGQCGGLHEVTIPLPSLKLTWLST